MVHTAGGLSDLKPADAVIEQVLSDIKASVEEKLGRSLDIYTPISYKTQVVAGINYFVKVKVSDVESIHLRIYKHFSGSTSLHDVNEGKTLEDEIVYF